ncbi:hypothetical protein EDB84DRAFT_1564551 [Lactarius hengduanensis]|nr:hypothetical protein EDB84DRAFT_1564551 [Lactarius hengduanensis]
MPMVALVATALYATLYEWHGGAQQISEFSANAYLDVYLVNVNTLKHILNNRECSQCSAINSIIDGPPEGQNPL